MQTMAKAFGVMHDEIDIRSAAQDLMKNGVCQLEQAVDAQEAVAAFDYLQAEHAPFFSIENGDGKLFVSDRRFFAALPVAGPLALKELLLPSVVEAVAEEVLGADFLFDSWGIINALPGAPDQHWHRDGGILFPGHPLQAMLPPSALTLAIPLVEMNAQTGSTGFAIGTHLKGENSQEPDFEPVVPVGSALLWDYRVLHKGMANRSESARPIIYATLCRPWWSDHINHKDEVRMIIDEQAMAEFDPSLSARLVRAQIAG